MFEDAADALEEIEPADKSRKELLGTRIDLYMGAKKWDTATTMASHLVKIEPENASWWIHLAYATRRAESIEEAETIILRARELHHVDAMIEFNLACYVSVAGRLEEAKTWLQRSIELNNDIRRLALDDEDLKPL